ncbi:MAG: GIY-YIG nuclease family protein [Candidatus Heimdallarchaeaceae archaeon]
MRNKLLIGPIIAFTQGLKGSYLLFIYIREPFTITLKGKEILLTKGCYIYTGSAFGAGGLSSRISRHLRKNKRAHWHIDKITLSDKSEIQGVLCFIDQQVECTIGKKFSKMKELEPILGFGNSDCKEKCLSHFFKIL